MPAVKRRRKFDVEINEVPIGGISGSMLVILDEFERSRSGLCGQVTLYVVEGLAG